MDIQQKRRIIIKVKNRVKRQSCGLTKGKINELDLKEVLLGPPVLTIIVVGLIMPSMP